MGLEIHKTYYNVVTNGKSIRYSYSKYGKDLALKLANYSLKTGKRLNNWYEHFENNISIMYIYNKYMDKNIEVYINTDMVEKIKPYYWRLEHPKKDKSYIVTSDPNKPKGDMRLHRFLMNCPDNMVVDHKNGNPFINTRKNLRIVTINQNYRNREINNSDWNNNEFIGVRKCSNRNGYEAWWIDINGNKKTKFFSCNLLGEEEALLEAVYYREEMEIQNNYLRARYRIENKLNLLLNNILIKKKNNN